MENSLENKYDSLLKEYEKVKIQNSRVLFLVNFKDQLIQRILNDSSLYKEGQTPKSMKEASRRILYESTQLKFDKAMELVDKYLGIITDLYQVAEEATGIKREKKSLIEINKERVIIQLIIGKYIRNS